ncbi:transcriptional regulator [Verrucomicrobia bacterium LW23]|nr:transcriptional regulator [Verrucomicrobia bacterium LW23]
MAEKTGKQNRHWKSPSHRSAVPAPKETRRASTKKLVVIGLLGPQLDRSTGPDRWNMWRPSVALCQHEELLVSRFEVLYQQRFEKIATQVRADIAQVSPETTVRSHYIEFVDPWDFEEVYGALLDFARGYPFSPETEDYAVHITTGTHVAQICLFLLTEARYIPGILLQTSPSLRGEDSVGTYSLIDLDLSRYDRLATRFHQEKEESVSLLKSGISTRSASFNALIEQMERVALASRDPMLLTGPTGAGKSHMARKVYELRKQKRLVTGEFVSINCATIRGDAAMSTLFGHIKGSFTGAMRDRPGLLKAADGGLLFLDEIGELGCDEQAMLLRALEERLFLPLGADREVASNFQLIAGTNRDLQRDVAEGRFREDLLARIDLWTFRLPGLRERAEDIEPNLDFELEKLARAGGDRVAFNKEARDRYLAFATGREATWSANFRDLNASVVRMSTFSRAGRITVEVVDQEIERLRAKWAVPGSTLGRGAECQDEGTDSGRTAERVQAEAAEIVASQTVTRPDLPLPLPDGVDPENLDSFDLAQLQHVIHVCRQSRTISDAGRALFAISRTRRRQPNDADRLRKYLIRFGLSWESVQG